MEIAVLADIHSNYVALETCMRFALKRGIRKFLFLGDYIGEMAYPERTGRNMTVPLSAGIRRITGSATRRAGSVAGGNMTRRQEHFIMPTIG